MLALTRSEYCLAWKKAPQLRHIPAATPPGSWILAPPPCTPCTPSFFSPPLLQLRYYSKRSGGNTTIDDIDYLLAESSSAAGFKGTLILCQHGRLCRSVSRQTSYDAGYTAVLLAA